MLRVLRGLEWRAGALGWSSWKTEHMHDNVLKERSWTNGGKGKCSCHVIHKSDNTIVKKDMLDKHYKLAENIQETKNTGADKDRLSCRQKVSKHKHGFPVKSRKW